MAAQMGLVIEDLAPGVMALMATGLGIEDVLDTFLDMDLPLEDILDGIAVGDSKLANDVFCGWTRWGQRPWQVIDGNVNLAGRKWLTKLPRNLEINGNLDLSGCVALEEIPWELRVHGKLILKGCSTLKRVYGEKSVLGIQLGTYAPTVVLDTKVVRRRNGLYDY